MAKESTFMTQQKVIVGVIAVVVIGIIGYFSTLVVQDTPILGDFVEGEHYTVLENPRRVRGDKIEVMEFFSYACPHCYTFDPDLMRWVEDNKDTVRFVRTPAVGSDYWRLLGQHYYTMETLGMVEEAHMGFFREIHDVKRQFTSPGLLARFYDGQGTTEAEYLETFTSQVVEQKLAGADQMGRRMQIVSVPTVVIDGRYVVKVSRAVGPNRMLDVMDHLVEKAVAAKAGDSAAAE